MARLIEERDGKASVEVDGPFNAAARRGGANYTLHLEVPHTNPILATAEECMQWPLTVLMGYLTHVGVGSNSATLGELLYNDTGQGRVANQTIALGVAERFDGAISAANAMRLLTELCAAPLARCSPPQRPAPSFSPQRAPPVPQQPALHEASSTMRPPPPCVVLSVASMAGEGSATPRATECKIKKKKTNNSRAEKSLLRTIEPTESNET